MVSGVRGVWVEVIADAEPARASLADVPVPPGYLPRHLQERWRRLFRHLVFRAILDAAAAPYRSPKEREALGYLRDRENARLFEFAGLPPDGVREIVKTRGRLRRTAALVRRYLQRDGTTALMHARAVDEGRGGGLQPGEANPWGRG